MYREDIIKRKVETPDYTTETNDDQSTVNKGTEADLAELSCDAAFQDIADRMECRVVGVANEIYSRSVKQPMDHKDEILT